MGRYYTLTPTHRIREADVHSWGQFTDKPENVRVAEATVGTDWVSTVFLGLDHNFGDGPPLLFETMIFGQHSPAIERGVWRYSTWGEAKAGHERVVAALREGREP